MKMKCKKLVKALAQIQSVSTGSFSKRSTTSAYRSRRLLMRFDLIITEYENCLKFFHDELKTVVQSFQPESHQELGTRLVDSLVEAAAKQSALLRAHEQLLAQPLREFLDSNNTSHHVRLIIVSFLATLVLRKTDFCLFYRISRFEIDSKN